MNAPNTEMVVETFIPVPITSQVTTLQLWQQYVSILRTKVSPLVKNLKGSKLISWYSFLLHNRASGVPSTPDDVGLYIHLRVELAPFIQENQVRKALPDYCQMTRIMPGPHPHPISGLDASFMKDGDIAQAWKVLGESSEWVLSMLDAHAPDQDLPLQHLAQFLHFIGNQVMASSLGIPTP